MSEPLDPREIFDRSADEGERRLNQSTLELVSTGFIAGFTIVFGIIALAIVDALARPVFGEFAQVVGALAFGVGIVFLIVGRAECSARIFSIPSPPPSERRRVARPARSRGSGA